MNSCNLNYIDKYINVVHNFFMFSIHGIAIDKFLLINVHSLYFYLPVAKLRCNHMMSNM